ncbi:MAG: cytochrome c [Oxalicibacterium faecigallinarum]|uniref:cytochrome c n=1 Tax=Oxalicibacterium faecigallinarum TaxID=573741 RepID=UPI00280947E5|nr:cytochrome c [Oxalicibacterium faecigallinarum]MDQ7968214.1 cytochrome c [Oxalicibacterium faecigallinarum]
MHPSFSFILRLALTSVIAACALFGTTTLHADNEPTLTLSLPNQEQKLARSNLLRHTATHTITVPDDPAYKRTMTYQAIPFAAIVRDMRHIDTLQFTSADGFVANIPGELFRSASEPWIAIEPAGRPWPALSSDSLRSAGAFYLVWLTPEKSGVKAEQWPFQIISIRNVEALTVRYPQLLPGTEGQDEDAQAAVQRGMQQFVMQCASCHRLNGGGDADVGPDLNLPFSPTEYFQEAYLRKLIRHPAAVRNWPQARMPAFGEAVISDNELDDLLTYLQQMARQRDRGRSTNRDATITQE